MCTMCAFLVWSVLRRLLFLLLYYYNTLLYSVGERPLPLHVVVCVVILVARYASRIIVHDVSAPRRVHVDRLAILAAWAWTGLLKVRPTTVAPFLRLLPASNTLMLASEAPVPCYALMRCGVRAGFSRRYTRPLSLLSGYVACTRTFPVLTSSLIQILRTATGLIARRAFVGLRTSDLGCATSAWCVSLFHLHNPFLLPDHRLPRGLSKSARRLSIETRVALGKSSLLFGILAADQLATV